MMLKEYCSTNNEEIVALFFETVHSVNKADYAKSQLDVWAPENINPAVWCRPFLEDDTIIAEDNGKIIGFGNITKEGYLDRLFVHAGHQGKGVAKAICSALEDSMKERGISTITTHASITARPFFEKQGYAVLSENIVHRQGVELINFKMEKRVQ